MVLLEDFLKHLQNYQAPKVLKKGETEGKKDGKENCLSANLEGTTKCFQNQNQIVASEGKNFDFPWKGIDSRMKTGSFLHTRSDILWVYLSKLLQMRA